MNVTFLSATYGSPVFLASGILGETASSLMHVSKAGAGCVVTKSVGREPSNGNPNPVYYSCGHYTINCMGLPNPGIGEYRRELEKLKSEGIAFAGSVFSDTPRGFADLAAVMEEHGARFVELNISCPNREGVGDSIAGDLRLVKEIVSACSSTLSVPVLPKLPPALRNVGSYASSLMDSGASGFVCTNTARGMHIDPRAKVPFLSRKFGGVAGPALKPLSLYTVWKVYEETGAPIIGVGGISTGIDAAEFLLAGAQVIEIGSVVERDGPFAFTRIRNELKAYLEEEGFGGISEVTGLAHR